MRKSSRLNIYTKQEHIYSTTGSKYEVSVSQLEDNGELHTDAHMLFMKMQEEQPDIITAIMTQLSLKAGSKEWVTKSHNAVHYDMKKVRSKDMYKKIHWKELDKTQRKSVL